MAWPTAELSAQKPIAPIQHGIHFHNVQ